MFCPSRIVAVCLLLAAILWAGSAASAQQRQPGQSAPTGQRRPGPTFDPATFAAHTRFLASDLLEGRGTFARGGRLAAAYIETVFREAGLRPGAGDSYLQPVPMELFMPDRAAAVTFSHDDQQIRLVAGDDFALVNVGEPSGVLRAEPLFVGYAISAPEENWDDWKGVDVRGRLLVAFVNEPGRDDPRSFKGRELTLHGRWRTKLEDAARRGAAGMLLIHTDADAGYAWTVARSAATVPTLGLADDPGRPAMAGWIREAPARELLRLAGFDLDSLRRLAEQRSFRPVPLPVTVEIAARLDRRPMAGTNVVGILPGAGRDAVVLMAHYDHLGFALAVNGDSIYNGAVDNATAVATLLALAQAYARTPAASHPTLVFLAVDAEESGLLGSAYHVLHPAVPLERTLATINFEMSNPWGRTRDVLVIGAPFAGFSQGLGGVLQPLGMRVVRDPVPEQGYLFRSDQLAWLKAGVPAAWIDGGMDYVGKAAGWGDAKRAEYRAQTYHTPFDDVRTDFDYSGLVQLADITVGLIREIGAGRAAAWKNDPELVAMRRPTAGR
jgi:Zn-dependent M28 family amino/carboxypeptidase